MTEPRPRSSRPEVLNERAGPTPAPERSVRVDLHLHTYYSHDSVLSPRRFVREARRRGLDVLAVTDHNTIRGALAVREVSDRPVIIGEEVKSADGEVLGLFLSQEVPRGLSASETIARIKDQGGIVGIPHPFDPLRLALGEDIALALINQIDFIEALNARIVFPGNNTKARDFAAAHGLPRTAGSDAHSPHEVGQCYVEMPPFEGSRDFLDALRHGRLKGRISSPLVHLVSRYAHLRRVLGWKPPPIPAGRVKAVSATTIRHADGRPVEKSATGVRAAARQVGSASPVSGLPAPASKGRRDEASDEPQPAPAPSSSSASHSPLTIGWFSTGRGPGSRRLLAAAHDEIASGRLNARIAAVFCNRGPGEDENTDIFLEQVRDYGLPLACISSRDFRRQRGERPVRKGEPLPEWRGDYDREVMRLLAPFQFDIGILAGYMLIFTEEFLNKHNLLNLHPAAPGGPKGVWQDVIWQLIESRAERAGVMMHLATAELDEGPTVTYCTYPIRGPDFDQLWGEVPGRSVADIKATEGEGNPLFLQIRRHGVARELPLVIETIRAFADRRIQIADKQPADPSGNPIPPFDLTSEIERNVAAQITAGS